MMLIRRNVGVTRDRVAVTVIFGLGLIGRMVGASLLRQDGYNTRTATVDWRDATLRAAQFKDIAADIAGIGPSQVDIVWTAGKAGFGAGADDIAAEEAPFNDVVGLSERLWGLLPSAGHRFHLMSSAGGLYEGCRLVGLDTPPAPKRPYGAAKLAQEIRCKNLPAGIATCIYRPSSVYGYAGAGGRAGLINVLVNNAWRHAPSRLFGDSATVRDYVYAADIGDFVAARIGSADQSSGTFLLASGKPSAMHEVVHTVERVIGQRLFVRFEPNPTNAQHITFCASALPKDWKATDLETGIRQTARKLLYSFATRSAA